MQSTLSKITRGSVTVVDVNGATMRFNAPDLSQDNSKINAASLVSSDRVDRKQTTIFIHDDCFYVDLLLHADIGFAESFIRGHVDVADMTTLLEIFIANRDNMNDLNLPTAIVGNLLSYMAHSRLITNSLALAKKNIQAHYDLGNELFTRFLDDSMMYSCAIWSKPEETLYDAQLRKVHAMIDLAHIGPNDNVLEIGTGWGTLAIEVVKKTGCRVTSITLSEQQLAYAIERVKTLPKDLQDKIDLRLMDYRNLPDNFPEHSFTRLVSIEMIEAVGPTHLTTFFETAHRMLCTKTGILAMQAITIPENKYDAYKMNVDFIQKHIFPGGHCPSFTALVESGNSGSEKTLTVDQVTNIGPHYARTLRTWRERLEMAYPELRVFDKHLPNGEAFYGDEFLRKWQYYFSYCEAGFRMRILNVLQIRWTRAGNLHLIDGHESSVF